MVDSDDFGDFDDDALITAATQVEQEDDFASSPRPSKKRKLDAAPRRTNDVSIFDGSDDIEPLVPSLSSIVEEEAEYGQNGLTRGPYRPPGKGRALVQTMLAAKKPKHKLHAPTRAEELQDAYYTEPPQSSHVPWKIRGAVIQKQARVEATEHAARPQTATKEPAESLEKENINDSNIADNHAPPSDEFGSSPVFQEQEDDIVYISSTNLLGRQPPQRLVAPLNGLRQTTLFGSEAAKDLPLSQVNKRRNWPLTNKEEPPTHHELDREAIKTWVYPTNLGTIRDYQFNIVARGLYHNLLVALPTGLGKTFIAATIMLNWFRWTKSAQIVFMAPTKPLVSQQVEACFGIAGIPRSQTTMLTGNIAVALRAPEWETKRVFFMTPQTLINDLKTGIADPKRIVLLVIDEAHRATGGYAYVEVVKFIRRFNESFRVLALTATPGSDVESVQKVIDGLEISRVEIRTEQSLDIRQYVNSRSIDKQVFDYSEEMEMCMELFSKAVRPVLVQLKELGVYWSDDPCAMTLYGMTMARSTWMGSNAGKTANFGLKGKVNSLCTTLISLGHGIELLKYHGMMPFLHSLRKFEGEGEEKQSNSKYKKQIRENESWKKLTTRLRTWCNNDDFIGHPKLEYLQEVVLNHFLDAGEGRGHEGQPPSSTRIMIFAHFRDSAEEIARVLRRKEPMIRPHVFVGQSASRNSEAMDQKKQLEVVSKFKSGTYNTLVATSIGEEGLDIGEVDLIICYDSKASPIRMLQRMGRTGRKRAGKIVLLQMRGKEENDAEKAKDNYYRMQEMIAAGTEFLFHDDISRRILPKDVQPTVDKRVVEIPLENSQPDLPEPRKNGKRAQKRPTKKFHMPDGVITGFVSASGKAVAGKNNGPRKRRKTVLEDTDEELPIPPLNEVLLSATEERQLEVRYQTVIDGEEELVVEYPSMTAHRQLLKSLRPTTWISHGGNTEAFVSSMAALRYTDEARLVRFEQLRDSLDFMGELSAESDCDVGLNAPLLAAAKTAPVARAVPKPKVPKPLIRAPKAPKNTREPKELSTSKTKAKGARAAKASDFILNGAAAESGNSSPVWSSPGTRIPTQGIDLGTQDSQDMLPEEEMDPDSSLADFVVDGSEEERAQDEGSSGDNGDDDDLGMDESGSGGAGPQPDSSLPSLATLTQKKCSSRKGARNAAVTIIDESDDEEVDVPDAASILAKREPAAISKEITAKRNRRAIVDSDDDE